MDKLINMTTVIFLRNKIVFYYLLFKLLVNYMDSNKYKNDLLHLFLPIEYYNNTFK